MRFGALRPRQACEFEIRRVGVDVSGSRRANGDFGVPRPQDSPNACKTRGKTNKTTIGLIAGIRVSGGGGLNISFRARV